MRRRDEGKGKSMTEKNEVMYSHGYVNGLRQKVHQLEKTVDILTQANQGLERQVHRLDLACTLRNSARELLRACTPPEEVSAPGPLAVPATSAALPPVPTGVTPTLVRTVVVAPT